MPDVVSHVSVMMIYVYYPSLYFYIYDVYLCMNVTCKQTKFPWNIGQYWRVCKGGVPLPGQGQFCINLEPGKQFLMHIWGKDY